MDPRSLEMNLRQSEMEAAGRQARLRGLSYPIRDCYFLQIEAGAALRRIREYARIGSAMADPNTLPERRVAYLHRVLRKLGKQIDMYAYRELMPDAATGAHYEAQQQVLDSLTKVSSDL